MLLMANIMQALYRRERREDRTVVQQSRSGLQHQLAGRPSVRDPSHKLDWYVAVLKAMLGGSWLTVLGVFTPIFAWRFMSPNNLLFTILRQFGTGIIIATAFIHVSQPRLDVSNLYADCSNSSSPMQPSCLRMSA